MKILKKFDIKRVFGKKKAEKYIGETNKKAKIINDDYYCIFIDYLLQYFILDFWNRG